MNRISLDIVSTDHTNCYLVNVSIYLATYPLDIYHLLGCFNLVSDTLSYLKIPEDAEIWQCNEELVLDIFWNEVLPIDTYISVLFFSKVQITNEIY